MQSIDRLSLAYVLQKPAAAGLGRMVGREAGQMVGRATGVAGRAAVRPMSSLSSLARRPASVPGFNPAGLMGNMGMPGGGGSMGPLAWGAGIGAGAAGMYGISRLMKPSTGSALGRANSSAQSQGSDINQIERGFR